jgi:hypothetical protein
MRRLSLEHGKGGRLAIRTSAFAMSRHGNLKRWVGRPVDGRIRPSLKVGHDDAMYAVGYCDLELEKLMPGFLRMDA